MGCDDSELWVTYRQNSRGGKPATTQLIELEFQSHKLNDLEDVLDHVFAQGWVESRYRSISWWEKQDGTKLKNGERVDALLKQGLGKCESTSLRLVIADCPPALWISYVFLKSPNAHAAVQRINLTDVADQCCKPERLAHVANYVFRKGYLPANVRSLVHWEDACQKRIEDHLCVKDVLCDRGVGKDEDKPLRLVIGLNSAFVAGWTQLEADSGSFKTIPPVTVEMREAVEVAPSIGPIPPEENLPPTSKSNFIPQISSPPYHTLSPTISSTSSPKPESLSETYTIPPLPSPPYQTFSPSSLSSTLSRPLTALDRSYSLWTLHYILFGTLLCLSYTAVLYPRIYCVCEQCRHQ